MMAVLQISKPHPEENPSGEHKYNANHKWQELISGRVTCMNVGVTVTKSPQNLFYITTRVTWM